MPRVLHPEGFKDLVDDVVAELAEEEGVTEEMVTFVVPDVYGTTFYSASDNDPRDRIHARLAFGEGGEGVKTGGFETGLQGIAAGGLRGALIGTGVVPIDELGPEATGVALENLGRVPDPHATEENEETGASVRMHTKSRQKDSPVEGEEVDAQ